MTRILFVDDDVKTLENLQRLLRPQKREWDMAFAAGGEVALTMLAASPFDVVVSDMHMPGMDGAALLETSRVRYPNVLRIILSQHAELEDSYRAVPVAHQFLLKPCDPGALRTAIERATSLAAVLNSKLLASLVGSLRELPSLPRVYSELREVLADPDVSIGRVVRIVEKDVAVSAKVLQLVNSAFFGVTREVTDIRTAVSYLGITVLQNLVLSAELLRAFQLKKPVAGFSLEEFHRHSGLTARIAAEIARTDNLPSAVAVAGLLHDVGKLVIAERVPEHFRRALDGSRQDKRPLFVVEEELAGVSHAEVGAYLLSLWGFPPPIVEAVAHHHHPGRVPQGKLDMISVTYLSNFLAHEQSERAADAAETRSSIDPKVLEAPDVLERLPEWRRAAGEMAREGAGGL